ncbi:DNA polymerase III tau subunit [Herbihabitans rhizosphaerae]|uniref:DNA polymerase III subunit gamma/tau n=1 Tax=Herbihabitans rhizosphaerae TaxID=1872711 RepID=A0A4Q7L6J8_9PSEU|nr:DNA polymerase III subunit gamma and tau [Herbihabitans rhizosphaerae]RZS44975.1 DNA polymerase III tau subunit [Herbihabitans rhizosphaerae]
MALALYRKYRPATFAEVVGQEHVTVPLRTALAAKRVNHAYLFSGPRGCGKTSSARILARSLNCEQGPTDEPCGTCDSCVALAPNGPGSVDVVELDAASHGGVDDARELRDRAFYAPAQSTYRVFIIDEAHMVTTQGFNALLKIVEEPPEHLVFIFATTEPDKVLATIRSRTHHYPFRLIPPGAMRELLERNCAAEGVTVEPAVFPLVIRAGGGSARDTQSVLDQLLAGAGPEGVVYERAVSLLGVTDVALIDDMVDALAAGDAATVYGTVDTLVEAGHDPRRFASDLLDRLRDLVLLRAVPEAGDRGLVTAPADELERMVAQAERIGPGTLSRFAEIVHNGLTEMRGATAPRLLLELLCARMLLPGAVPTDAAADSAVLQRLERIERRVTVSGEQPPAAPVAAAAAPAQPERPKQPATPEPPTLPEAPPAARRAQERTVAPAPQPKAEPEPAPVAEEPPAAASTAPGAIDAAAVRRVWPELLTFVRKKSRSTEAMLSQAGVQSVEGDTVVIAHSAEPLARRLAEQRNTDVVAEALTAVIGGSWRVRCVHGGGGGGSARPASRPSPQPSGPAPSRPPARSSESPQRSAPARRPSGSSSGPAADDVPPPPEPPPDEPPPPDDEDEEAMLAEAARAPSDGERAQRRDPEEAAIDLLAEHLGARKIER